MLRQQRCSDAVHGCSDSDDCHLVNAHSVIVISALCSNRTCGETDFSTVMWLGMLNTPKHYRITYSHGCSILLCLTYGVLSHAPDNTSVLTS